MTMTRKTITIPEAMEDWVKAQISDGRYASDSEYFRDLILYRTRFLGHKFVSCGGPE